MRREIVHASLSRAHPWLLIRMDPAEPSRKTRLAFLAEKDFEDVIHVDSYGVQSSWMADLVAWEPGPEGTSRLADAAVSCQVFHSKLVTLLYLSAGVGTFGELVCRTRRWRLFVFECRCYVNIYARASRKVADENGGVHCYKAALQGISSTIRQAADSPASCLDLSCLHMGKQALRSRSQMHVF